MYKITNVKNLKIFGKFKKTISKNSKKKLKKLFGKIEELSGKTVGKGSRERRSGKAFGKGFRETLEKYSKNTRKTLEKHWKTLEKHSKNFRKTFEKLEKTKFQKAFSKTCQKL
jgi:hypothetical protein